MVTATCKISALHVRHVLRQCTAHVLPSVKVVACSIFWLCNLLLCILGKSLLNILVASISFKCLRTFRKRIWEGSHRFIYSIRCNSWVLCRLLLYRWCLVCLFLPQHALRLCLSFSQPICCRFCLLLICCSRAAERRLGCCYCRLGCQTAAQLLPNCCPVAAKLLLDCFPTAASLLLPVLPICC